MKNNRIKIKDARQEVRLSSSDKAKLKLIASRRGLTVSELIMQSLQPILKEYRDN